VILTGHTHDALPEPVQVGNTFLIASGSNGKFVSRVDLDVQRRPLHGLQAQADPDLLGRDRARSGDGALIDETRAPFKEELEEVIGTTGRSSTGAAISTARGTT
jgi:sulfur-oxidizing protein SoxB